MPLVSKKDSQDVHPTVRRWRSLGVLLDPQPGTSHAYADCPFCQREGKLSVDLEAGLWRCLVCATGTEKGGGNVYTFMRMLWGESSKRTNGESNVLAADRRLLFPETLTYWGAAVSILTGEWLLPGYSVDKKLSQLYRYGKNFTTGKRLLYATADLPVQMYGMHLFDPSRQEVFVCEGPWDAMALWELLRITKRATGGGFVQTASESSSLLADANVVAIPGCQSFQPGWAKPFAGKTVYLMSQSDHPKLHCKACKKAWSSVTNKACPTCRGELVGPEVKSAGWHGMKKVCELVSSSGTPPKEVYVLTWGPDGYDSNLSSGYDVRDHLDSPTIQLRQNQLGTLLERVKPIPSDWVPGRTVQAGKVGSTELVPTPCDSWEDLLDCWKKAMAWRPVIEDVLATMLAVVASTEQSGVQLMLQVIGDAGSGKTRLCDALLVSKRCYAIEHMKGFFSGWKADQGEDYSVMARANKCTWVTAEGDVLMASPNFHEIMSQIRRAFDGSSQASYKTLKDDRKYDGLRIPWIIAGTAVLLDMNQARLGDRFLKIMFTSPDEDEKRDILQRVGHTALRAVLKSSNCTAGSIMEEKMREAYCMTGGYVDYLRANVEELMGQLDIDAEMVVGRCAELAEFTAFVRARPAPEVSLDKHVKEAHDSKELPTRLTEQYVRLAVCLAVALGKRTVDERVMELVKKVAIDTCRGRTMDLINHLARIGLEGMSLAGLAHLTGQTDAKEAHMLRFLRRIGAAELFKPKTKVGVQSNSKWRLTPRMRQLYDNVFLRS